MKESAELMAEIQQLKAENEILKRSNAEKDKFFSIVAHDLRNPFNSFLGLTELMAEGLSDMPLSQIQSMAKSMNTSANNIYRLLENLLEWAQLQMNTMSLSVCAIDLYHQTMGIIQPVLASADVKWIEVNINIQKELIVFADKNMLGIIIQNLVSNAVKFTPKRGEILISAKEIEGDLTQISIKDTGIGMNQNLIDNLFRLDIITNREGTEGEPSSGLGLILCKEFVEKQGGKLWLESEEGKGSTFHFTLPNK